MTVIVKFAERGAIDALLYLANHTEWLAHHPSALQAFDELEHAAALVQTSIAGRETPMFAGPCDGCRRDLYAQPDADTVECVLCGITYDMNDRLDDMLDRVADHLDTAANIADAVTNLGEPVSADAIRKWKERGRLTIKGYDRRNRPLYRVGDVLELRRMMRRTATRRAV